MEDGWRYRLLSASGSVLLTVGAVLVVNQPVVLASLETIPVIGRLPGHPAAGLELQLQALTTALVVVVVFAPTYRPTSRRILDTVFETGRRSLIAVVFLASLGYFDYTYRLPRLTLFGIGVVLFTLLPAWFLAIRQEPILDAKWLLIGDAPAAMSETYASFPEASFAGYVSPGSQWREGGRREIADGGVVRSGQRSAADFSTDLPRLGGMARLPGVLSENEISTVVAAFSRDGRGQLYSALREARARGVRVKVHRTALEDGAEDGDAGEPVVEDVTFEAVKEFME